MPLVGCRGETLQGSSHYSGKLFARHANYFRNRVQGTALVQG